MIKSIFILLGFATIGTILLMALMYFIDLAFSTTRYVSLDDLEERIKKFNKKNRESI